MSYESVYAAAVRYAENWCRKASWAIHRMAYRINKEGGTKADFAAAIYDYFAMFEWIDEADPLSSSFPSPDLFFIRACWWEGYCADDEECKPYFSEQFSELSREEQGKAIREGFDNIYDYRDLKSYDCLGVRDYIRNLWGFDYAEMAEIGGYEPSDVEEDEEGDEDGELSGVLDHRSKRLRKPKMRLVKDATLELEGLLEWVACGDAKGEDWTKYAFEEAWADCGISYRNDSPFEEVMMAMLWDDYDEDILREALWRTQEADADLWQRAEEAYEELPESPYN